MTGRTEHGQELDDVDEYLMLCRRYGETPHMMQDGVRYELYDGHRKRLIELHSRRPKDQ